MMQYVIVGGILILGIVFFALIIRGLYKDGVVEILSRKNEVKK